MTDPWTASTQYNFSVQNPWSSYGAVPQAIKPTTISKLVLTDSTGTEHPNNSFELGQTIRVHAYVQAFGAGGSSVFGDKYVYMYFGDTVNNIKLFRTKKIPYFWNSYDVWTDFNPKSELGIDTPGDYVIAARTSDEQNTHTVNLTLTAPAPPGKAMLNVSTKPSGASIYINEKYVGISPISLPLDPGTYKVKAVIKGYEFKGCDGGQTGAGYCVVTLKAGESKPLTINLVKPPTPWWQDALKYGLVGAGIGLVGLMLMRSGAAGKISEVVVPIYQKSKEVAKKGVSAAKKVASKVMR